MTLSSNPVVASGGADAPMTDVAAICAAMGPAQRMALTGNGEVMGMPYAAAVMRPLIRRGLFTRVERKGYQVRWAITPRGLAARSALMKDKAL